MKNPVLEKESLSGLELEPHINEKALCWFICFPQLLTQFSFLITEGSAPFWILLFLLLLHGAVL